MIENEDVRLSGDAPDGDCAAQRQLGPQPEEIRHQVVFGTDSLIQSSCMLEIGGAQYLIKVIAKKKVMQMSPITSDELAGMYPACHERVLITFEP